MIRFNTTYPWILSINCSKFRIVKYNNYPQNYVLKPNQYLFSQNNTGIILSMHQSWIIIHVLKAICNIEKVHLITLLIGKFVIRNEMYTVKDMVLMKINSTLTSQYRIHSRCSLINKLFIIGSRLTQSASVTTQLFVWSLFFCFFQPLNKRCHLQNKQRLT